MDSAILSWIHQRATPALDVLFRWSNALGTTAFCLALVLAVLLWHAVRRERAEGTAWVVVGLTTLFLSSALKLVVARPRPTLWSWMVPVSGFSFPSGHAITSAAFFPLLGWLALRSRPREGALGYLMGVVLAAYVGIGRLYLGVHWPTDVLAGWALGLAQSAMAVWWLARIRCAPSSFSKGGPMRSTRTLGAAVAAGLLAACAEASIPAPPTGYGFAYATRDCGPADGPAVRLFLVPQEVTLWPPSGARVEVAVWRATTQLPGADLVWSGATNLGWAGRCDDVAQCEAATDARVTFRGFAADSTLTGSVDLGFGDGSRVTGGFNAVWHPATPICG